MLRKLIAFHFLILFVLCSFQVGVKSHYCGGELVGSILVSGDGEISCGMIPKKNESDKTGSILKKKCCENFIAKLQFHSDFSSSNTIAIYDLNTLIYTPLNHELKIQSLNLGPFWNITYSLAEPPNISVANENLARLQAYRI